jgi:uncharacterized repeat protein (TIGR04052 family)
MRYPILLAYLLLAACGEPEVTVQFEGLIGGEPAACGAMYDGVGSTGTTLELLDYRLYVHDIRLVTEDGREVPLALTPDGAWQNEEVALLDFEGGDGCDSGTAGTNSLVRGTVAEGGPFTGIRFRLGVPSELNHADASTAAAPLNFTSLFWSWNAGYKFLRVEGRTTGLTDGWRIHLGSTACEGDGRGNVTGCAQDNRPEIALDGFDPEEATIAVDLAAILDDSNLDEDAGGPGGCMSGLDDPECGPIFHALGLPFGDAPAEGPQRLFAVQ